MTIPKWCTVVFSPPHRVVETVSWLVPDYFRMSVGQFKALLQMLVPCLTRQSTNYHCSLYEVGKLLKCRLVIYPVCIGLSKLHVICLSAHLVPRETRNELVSQCCWCCCGRRMELLFLQLCGEKPHVQSAFEKNFHMEKRHLEALILVFLLAYRESVNYTVDVVWVFLKKWLSF